ncbi:MAG: U32 family peptidase C-terminal domain-containing protein, partial [Clostridia bacterium]|nr:U32 family peptidase C-terminal domain-containing protein [Clostridia bacterium]
SFKIEGRMKSPYYVATVVNAYRRVIDAYYEGGCKKFAVSDEIKRELLKASHRKYTTGFTFDDGEVRQNYESAGQEQDSKFMAIVLDGGKGQAVVEQRNKFSVGDKLEILSPSDAWNKKITIAKIVNSKGEEIESAKHVQEKITIIFDDQIELFAGDLLRM